MNKFLITIIISLITLTINSQELNCKVVVSADKIVDANQQVFKTMERAVSEFMNQTAWTSQSYRQYEKIDCSLILTLVSKSGNNFFSGSIQVLSSRPVFNSVYTSPILNYKDESLSFSYTEFEPLVFDSNTYQSELISTLSYFAYMIIGLDKDTFSPLGGEEAYESAKKIIDLIDSPDDKKAWESDTNKFNRYHFVTKLLSPSLKEYRQSLYKYHIEGMDIMSSRTEEAKKLLKQTLLEIGTYSDNSMDSQIIRTFMDAKADEIVSVFSDGPNVPTQDLISSLMRMSPTNSHKWEKIK